MLTVQWQRRFEGLSVSQECHQWGAGEFICQPAERLNIMQACIRRPVRARLARPFGNDRRIGRLVLTPAGMAFEVETLGEETEFPVRKYEFDADWLGRLAADTFDFHTAQPQPIFDDPIISGTLERIYAEMASPGQASSDLLASLTRILAIDMARLLVARGNEGFAGERGLTAEQLARVQLSIETTDFKDLTPAKVAADCGMSVSRLRDSFRRTTGISLREQIEQARIAAACRILTESGHPLKMIAHLLGFGHASAFCYWFKTATGSTPTEYRMRNIALCGTELAMSA